MKKLLVFAVSAICALGVVSAEDDAPASEGAKKVRLEIVSVETPSTRTKKWNPPQVPLKLKPKPFLDADINKAPADEARKMILANRQVDYENSRLVGNINEQRQRDATAHYKGMMAKLEGTAFGRQLLIAVDKFTGAANKHFDSDYIEFFHVMDSDDEANKTEIRAGKRPNTEIVAPYFVKLIFDDPRTEVKQGYVAGTLMRRTFVKLSVICEVQKANGVNLPCEPVTVETSARDAGTGGADESALIVEAIDEALDKVAQNINKLFVAKTTVKVIPAKKDKEFDVDSATLEIDGEQVEIGEEISLLRGRHSILVELDGYEQIGSKTVNVKKSGTIKVKMRKVEEKKAGAEEGANE